VVSEQAFPASGDRVLVPWGLEEVMGEVVEVYATGLGDKAVVRLLGFSDSNATVTVPADSLIRAEGPSGGMSPRIEAMQFEHEILSAVQGIAGDIGASMIDQGHLDRGIDAVVNLGTRDVAIQVKYFGSGRVPSDTISVVAAYARTTFPLILVTNADLTRATLDRWRNINKKKKIVWFVRWSGPPSYIELRQDIQEALGLLPNDRGC
jgi:hypothetical protein